MAFDFDKIPEKKADVVFEYEGQTLNVVMNLNKFTQDALNTNDFAYALSQFVESWDAKDKLTPAFLSKLPVSFLMGLYRACAEVALPKAMTVGR